MILDISEIYVILQGFDPIIDPVSNTQDLYFDYDEAIFECERRNFLEKEKSGDNISKSYLYYVRSLKEAIESTIEKAKEDEQEDCYNRGWKDGRDSGYEEGYDAGYDEGIEQGRSEGER